MSIEYGVCCIMIKKILLGILLAGLIIAIISVFGNPFNFFGWVWDWIIWAIQSIANVFSGNHTFREVAQTRPSDLALITMTWFH
jgi:membrane protein implicated in regulation of membrane protease activity